MVANRNFTNKTVHVHDKVGNVHLIPPGAPFPEWAVPQTKSQSLVIQYRNQPLNPDIDADRAAIARANDHKPVDPRSLPRGITVSGNGAGPTRLDSRPPEQPDGPQTYEEKLAALKAKYRIGESPELPNDREPSEWLSAQSSIFDSCLWGPAEAERRRQAGTRADR